MATVYRGEHGTDRYAAALRFAGRRVDVRRPGIDVTISAPKSVSVLYGLGDPDVAAAVRDAHRAAVEQALGYLESVAGHGLLGHQGDGQRANRIRTDGWIVAAFEHRTSRAGDPQLHTHLVVPNLLHGNDGKWSAIDSKAIYRHALTASYLYHAVLRGQLTQRLGVAWTTPVKGIAEVAGLPPDLLRTFSTRRRQNHLYVPDEVDDGRTPVVNDQGHLDRLAARLAVRRSQILATRQLPRTGTNRWRSSTSHDPMHRRAEGRSL